MLTSMRTGIAGVALALALWGVMPAPARADGPHAQMSFLARMAIDLTVERLTLEDEFLIRLPEPEPKPPSSGALGGQTEGVVALLGAGLDVTSPDEDPGSIVLQLKPNLGRRGGLLRCTFRF